MIQGYLKNAAILTAAGLLLRLAGMLLRVRLAVGLGSEGMGVYQLIFTVYGFSIALATSGISVASTRISAERLAFGPGALRRTLWKLLGMGAVCGGFAGMAQYLLAGPAAIGMLGDVRCVLSLRVLAFSLPFMGMGAAMRGWFLAQRKVFPGVLSQLAEQAVRVGIVLWVLQKTAGFGLALCCAAVVTGNTVSEAFSWLLMLAASGWESHRLHRLVQKPGGEAGQKKREKAFLPELFSILFPVQGERCVSSALHAAETALVPSCLTLYLGSRSAAVAQFGELRGMALPLMTFPFSILGALSGLLLPEIARARSQNNKALLQRLVGRMLTLTVGISLFAGAFFAVWAAPLAELVYHDISVGSYLFWLAPAVPFMYVESMVDGVMKGIGEQLASFGYRLLDSVLRLFGILLLLPRIGMAGLLAVMLFSNALTCVLNLRRMLRVVEMPFRFWQWVVRPAVVLLPALAVCLAMQSALAGQEIMFRMGAAGGGMTLCFGVSFWLFLLRDTAAERGVKTE